MSSQLSLEKYRQPWVMSPSAVSFEMMLADYEPISLEAMGHVSLLRRVDTKLVLREAQLLQALAQVADDYQVLEISGCRVHRYQTLYFDTPDYMFYRQHHNGQRDRYKVRARAYLDSGDAFLEVKRKTNQDVTVKDRLPIAGITSRFDLRARAFLAERMPCAVDSLWPVLWTDFQRITLVSKHRPERMTLDIGLSWRAGKQGFSFPRLAVVEVKQSAYSLHSELMGRLRELGVRPLSFSKYCFGISQLIPAVKQNHFKPQQLWLGKLMAGVEVYHG